MQFSIQKEWTHSNAINISVQCFVLAQVNYCFCSLAICNSENGRREGTMSACYFFCAVSRSHAYDSQLAY